ncbi:hypothetical protein H6P81_019356 [Aristolochia fimbriata]|uniref:Cytochrome c oxidase copper chaperone n=1 Tax=Aristolochia fimbriata TaxID=158543 RepID=A0AAV7DSM0_ARIFI|nr:hypothetical protein H6P81_019356 [Aristolochia fimbriata]
MLESLFSSRKSIMGSSESRFSEQKSSSSLALSEAEPQNSNPDRATASASEAKPKKKICCACPDTKKQRDECIVEHGEAACKKWIDAHLECLRGEGFKV